MAGSALSAFTDFFSNATGPAYLTDPGSLINDASLRNYEALETVTRAKKAIQGGTVIKDAIMFSTNGQAKNYLPGEAATVTNTQNLSTISVPWRFVRVPITWDEHEILLNEGGGGKSAMFQQFKRLKDAKYQSAYTDLMNLLERNMVATASNANMEAGTGSSPYSIFATVTSDGLAPSGFTTVQGVNPATQSKWRNQTASWTTATPFDTKVGIIAGFDTMSQLVRFKRPPSAQQYFTDSDLQSHVILTNREGRALYMQALRANNDLTRSGPQDPAYGSPVFNNIPVKACEGFDDQGTFTATQPGFLFLNMNFLKLVFHEQKFMQKGPPMTFADKPDTTVVWVDTYYNLFNQSRLRHGFLAAA